MDMLMVIRLYLTYIYYKLSENTSLLCWILCIYLLKHDKYILTEHTSFIPSKTIAPPI